MADAIAVIKYINNKWEFQSNPQSNSFLHCLHVELGFGNVDFCEGRKTGVHGEENPLNENENQQQIQPRYDAETGIRTRDKLVGGECSHHCI